VSADNAFSGHGFLEHGENVFPFRRPGADPAENATAAGMLLGIQLRALRGERTTLQKVSVGTGFSVAKLSRLERAESPPKLRDVQRILRFYGADETVTTAVEELARHAVQPCWFHSYRDVCSHWLERLIALESAATQLVTYEAKIVPGLVQTEEYARELFRLTLPARLRHQLERRVGLRMERQQRFLVMPPRSVFYVEQSTLYRGMGTAQVMVDQIQRLIDLTHTSGFGVRIIALDTTFASSVSSLTRLAFEGGGLSGLPELIYNEKYDGADYLTPSPDEGNTEGAPPRVSEMEDHKELLTTLMSIGTERQESRILLVEAMEYWQRKI
jgi:transcriptional regulator with XRE-family HTH domain